MVAIYEAQIKIAGLNCCCYSVSCTDVDSVLIIITSEYIKEQCFKAYLNVWTWLYNTIAHTTSLVNHKNEWQVSHLLMSTTCLLKNMFGVCLSVDGE